MGYAGPASPFGADEVILPDGRFVINPQFEWAGGGFASTAADLARWARALYTGKAFDPSLLPTMLQGVPARRGLGRYGLGVIISDTPLGPRLGHSGFFPGYLTEMVYFPVLDLAVAIMVNTSVWTSFFQKLPDSAVWEVAQEFRSVLAGYRGESPGADTLPIGELVWSAPAMDSLLAVMDSLENLMEHATEAGLPELLLQLGRAKSAFRPYGGGPHDDYARARPEEYLWDEPSGSWGYNGLALHELLRRFPDSHLAVEAAYAITLLPLRGECEGFVSGCISWEWGPLTHFLRTHPEAPLADSAVSRTLAIFDIVEAAAELRTPTEHLDPEALGELVARLDSIGRTLPPARGARLLERAGELWEQFVDYERAELAYRAALPGADDVTRARLEARLASLPERWFTLEPALVLHPGQVELSWRSAGEETVRYLVHRSQDPDESQAVVAELAPEVLSWADTRTLPGTTYRYRVVAETSDGVVSSNPVYARTPLLRTRIQGIAISTTDRRLHAFGVLENGFPQVLRIEPDGSSFSRLDGMFLGVGYDQPDPVFHDHVDEIWLPDRNGHGVLRFDGTLGDPPADLLATIRMGHQHLQEYSQRPNRWAKRVVVNVDEANRAAWIHSGEGFASAVDCRADLSYCWAAGNREIVRHATDGTVLGRIPMPRMGPSDWHYATAVFADPEDGSAWVFFRASGWLVNVDTAGVFRHELRLAHRGNAWSLNVVPDFDGRALWYSLGGLTAVRGYLVRNLIRIDLADPELPHQVIAMSPDIGMFLAPDLEGGVYYVTWNRVTRFDRQGNAVFTLELSPS